jgi:hypothetical protein
MADEIKIENIGGENGIASEVTLVRLVTAMEKMAKTSGADPKSQAAKTQQAYNKAQQSGVKVSTKHRDAVNDNTKAVQSNTKYLNLMGSGLLKLAASGIGAAIGGLKGLAEELITGGDSLSSFVQHIPVFGGTLSMLTGIMDRSYVSFQSMAKSGGDLGYDLEKLRTTAAESRLNIEEFSSFVSQSSTMLAAFGGTVSIGAKQVAGMTDALGKDLRTELQMMGLSFEEINESMAMNAYLNRTGSKMEARDKQQQAEAAAGLTKNMLQLAKLTGEDVKAQQDKLAQASMDLAFQRELGKLEGDEKKNMLLAMAEAQATGGEVAVNALKASFLGMPPITRELQLFTATMPESAALIKKLLNDAIKSGMDHDTFQKGQEKRVVDYTASLITSSKNLDSIIRVGAVSADGVAGEINALANTTMDRILPYIKSGGEDIEAAKKEIAKNYKQILPEPPKDGELGAMAQFLETVKEAKLAIVTNLINPLVGAAVEVFGPVTEWFTGFVGEKGEATTFQNALAGFSKFIKEDVNPALKDFFEAFGKDPKKALKEAMFGDGKDKKGLLKTIMEPVGEALVAGFKTGLAALFENIDVRTALIAGITGLFAAKAVVAAMTAGIASLAALAMPKTSPTGAPVVPGGADPKGKMNLTKTALKRLGPLALLFGAYEIGSTAMNTDLTQGQKKEEYGAIGGGMAGAAAGAIAGSFIPLVGTAIGGLIGGTLGYFGGSSIGRAIMKDDGTVSTDTPSATDKDVAETLGVTPDTVKLLERMSGIGGGMERVASAFERIDKLERFSENVNAIQKGLDISELSKYNSNMQEIARSLEDMNKALAEDNKGLFGGTGVASADLLKKMGGSGPSTELINSINNNMTVMNDHLKAIKGTNATIAGDLK